MRKPKNNKAKRTIKNDKVKRVKLYSVKYCLHLATSGDRD